jgi:hypothetical protein
MFIASVTGVNDTSDKTMATICNTSLPTPHSEHLVKNHYISVNRNPQNFKKYKKRKMSFIAGVDDITYELLLSNFSENFKKSLKRTQRNTQRKIVHEKT